MDALDARHQLTLLRATIVIESQRECFPLLCRHLRIDDFPLVSFRGYCSDDLANNIAFLPSLDCCRNVHVDLTVSRFRQHLHGCPCQVLDSRIVKWYGGRECLSDGRLTGDGIACCPSQSVDIERCLLGAQSLTRTTCPHDEMTSLPLIRCEGGREVTIVVCLCGNRLPCSFVKDVDFDHRLHTFRSDGTT